jgi:myo-inositol-1(or 4)-monophosphatase
MLEAGDLFWEFAESRSRLQVEHKGSVDLVTRADREIQAFVVEEIRKAHPSDEVVAEESAGGGGFQPPQQPTWFVDPIDGTTNFVHGHHFSCISVARWQGLRPEIGAVFAPELDELYLAVAGGGATLETPRRGGPPRALEVSRADSLSRALLATGFPYDRGRLTRLNLGLLARFLSCCQGVRRAGSAALDLCWVADGRLDGYWEMGLHPWDVAAGLLVVLEAGGRVGDFEQECLPLSGRRVVASSPGIFEELLRVLALGHDDPGIDFLAPPLEAPVPRRGPLPGAGPRPPRDPSLRERT